MAQVRLTDRALQEIEEIERYSLERWGRRVADRYLDDIAAALDRLVEDFSLFKLRPDYTGRLRFYAVREHVLVGDVLAGIGYVVAVWHGAMHFSDRLRKLEPELIREAEILAGQIEGR